MCGYKYQEGDGQIPLTFRKGIFHMKWFSPIHSRKVLAVLCGIGIASGIAAFHAQADEWNKKTVLTVNEPIQVSDKLLDPGQYVFMLADSSSDRHIVRIFDANQQHLIDTVMATPNYRIQPTGNSRFSFWETPPGTAKALRAWFYPGDNFGQEFRYPAHPVVLQAKAEPAPTVTQPQPQPEPEAVTPTPVPQPAPETAAQTQPEQPEVAQNNPPPAPAPASQSPTPAPQEQQPQPKELPQTASPYPMIGLGGVALLALAGLLRFKRLA
jgi:LPXTG-motif cell wall-anchored protein